MSAPEPRTAQALPVQRVKIQQMKFQFRCARILAEFIDHFFERFNLVDDCIGRPLQDLSIFLARASQPACAAHARPKAVSASEDF